ncbi:hypothetical protein SAMN05444166_7871 [Singulisphaera sp. GP187]|uniref:hypothetical protein n=1 Tax=Singulisphaera sp. GP187 TaxID=1882752 RepID=UPI0009266671|nr:hypothetical protein [Singulisphaera sp. GP187]SIO65879.1 hypothetical protein SAMN05444166_7871 [Singulisphaera sp. GP187]
MTLNPGNSIVITDGHWMHIRHIQIYHRHYPEIRGEGASLAEAAAHLSNQLVDATVFAQGRGGRDGIVRALAEVRALRKARPIRRRADRDTVPAPDYSTIS